MLVKNITTIQYYNNIALQYYLQEVAYKGIFL